MLFCMLNVWDLFIYLYVCVFFVCVCINICIYILHTVDKSSIFLTNIFSFTLCFPFGVSYKIVLHIPSTMTALHVLSRKLSQHASKWLLRTKRSNVFTSIEKAVSMYGIYRLQYAIRAIRVDREIYTLILTSEKKNETLFFLNGCNCFSLLHKDLLFCFVFRKFHCTQSLQTWKFSSKLIVFV